MCTSCNGTGLITDYEVCASCKGTGVITSNEPIMDENIETPVEDSSEAVEAPAETEEAAPETLTADEVTDETVPTEVV